LLKYHSKKRKSRALGSGLPQCLADTRALSFNVISGCPLECNYCKYRARNFTPDDNIYLYSRLPTQLREELEGLKKRGQEPVVVLFNTVSESFFGHTAVNKTARRCLEILLDHGVYVNLTTKGIIPTDMFEVMARKAESITVTCTIASLSESFQRTFEPRVSPAQERLTLIRQLSAVGIPVRARIEPLMPMENDSEKQLKELLLELRSAGIRDVVISYLQMDHDVVARLKERIGRVQVSMLAPWYRDANRELTPLLDANYRKKKYQEIREMGSRLGMRIIVCACRNADMFSGRCFVVPEKLQKREVKTLF